jgi:Tol biopolymer transport system component
MDASSDPVWSPNNNRIAYSGKIGEKSGLIVANADGSGKRFLSKLEGTNTPLPSTGKTFDWSPDGKQIVFVDARPGPETKDVEGDPIVITRYLYKPDDSEGNSRLNDNKRLHLFLVEVSTGAISQLTTGNHYEHSVDWSPKGDEILFVSNREPNEDQFFNYDLFVLRVSDKSIRRLTATESIEYRPVWSPDGQTIAYQGCKRGLTDLETTMEDTHVWTIAADGTGRKEFAAIDNRQGPPVWSTDGARAARSTSFHKQFCIRPRASTLHSRRRSESPLRVLRAWFAICSLRVRSQRIRVAIRWKNGIVAQ